MMYYYLAAVTAYLFVVVLVLICVAVLYKTKANLRFAYIIDSGRGRDYYQYVDKKIVERYSAKSKEYILEKLRRSRGLL